MTSDMSRLNKKLMPKVGEELKEYGEFKEVRINRENRSTPIMHFYYEKGDVEAVIWVSRRMQLDTNIESYHVGLAAVKYGEAVAQRGKFDLMGNLSKSYSEFTHDWLGTIRVALNIYMEEVA